MKKFILLFIVCFCYGLSWSVFAQENPFQRAVCIDCNAVFYNSRVVVYLIFSFVFLLSLIGLFFKKIRKVCKWILIIGGILFILIAGADRVVQYATTMDSREDIPPIFFEDSL